MLKSRSLLFSQKSLIHSSNIVKQVAADPTASPIPQVKPVGEQDVKSRTLGSYHWTSERALAFISIPLMASAAIVGSHPMIDLGLGVVLPLHCHMGFGAIIDDYLPARRAGKVNTIAKVGLAMATSLALYGCFKFNTNDIGLTGFAKRLWKGMDKEQKAV